MNRFATTLLLLSFHLMACGGSLEDFDSILGMGQADFTIEIEEGPGSQESSLSIHSSRTVMNVPVLDQNNNSITSDCGLTATRMVFEYYGSIMRSFEPDSGAGLEGMTEYTMAALFKPSICGASSSGGALPFYACDWEAYGDAPDRYGYEGWGTRLDHLSDMFELYGLESTYYKTSEDGFGGASNTRFNILKRSLRRGRPVIVHVFHHYILATGYDADREEIYFNDPNNGRQYSISFDTFLNGTNYDSKKVWDGRMLIYEPQMYRVYLKMKANYDKNDNNGKGLYFYFTDTDGNQVGEQRNMNLFTSNADDGNWNTFWWRLDDEVADLWNDDYRFRLGMKKSNSKWVYLDDVTVKRYFNGSWSTIVKTVSVKKPSGGSSGKWYLRYNYNTAASVPKFRSILSQEF